LARSTPATISVRFGSSSFRVDLIS
jgi:hypothetical protein